MTQVAADTPAVERRTARAAWLLFSPPFAAAGLQWWLATLSQKDTTPLQALKASNAPTEGDIRSLMLQASEPFLWALAVVVVTILIVRWSWRRFGGARVVRVASGLWILLWAATVLAIAYSYLNRSGREAIPARTATVLQVRPQPASERGVGGAVVLARVPELALPQSVLLEEADADKMPPGTSVNLSLAKGKFSGLYVTDWRIEAPMLAPKQP